MTVGKRGVRRVLAAALPEKRIVTATDTGTRSLRIGPGLQLLAGTAAIATLAWLCAATAIVIADRIGTDTAAGPAAALHEAYERRLNALTEERDIRAAEAASAHQRFSTAIEQISAQQMALLSSIEERRELEAAVDLLRARLAEAVDQRDGIAAANDRLVSQMSSAATSLGDMPSGKDLAITLEAVTKALGDAVTVRDAVQAERETLAADLEAAELKLALTQREHSAMIAQVREAVATSSAPLEEALRRADLDVDSTIALIRQDYSGQGGPLVPIGVSTRSRTDGVSSTSGFDELMIDIDRMNMLRIAIGKVPYAVPVKNAFRFTSGFGLRRDPKGRGRRMHAGVDFAAPKGTPIYATGDGVVKSAQSESGYGLTVRIQHDFGFETVYAHQSRLRVETGQRVSRGEHIGDMGSTGRSTGVHLHYEVRLNGRPVNPMTYVEAAKDVF